MPSSVRKTTVRGAGATVVDLLAARERRRFEDCRARVSAVLEEHRRVLTDLVDSGLMFTRHGTRIGGELLRAQQRLMRVRDELAREARVEGCGCGELVQGLLADAEALLEKSLATAQRHRKLFERS
jgi:hypothetical protein